MSENCMIAILSHTVRIHACRFSTYWIERNLPHLGWWAYLIPRFHRWVCPPAFSLSQLTLRSFLAKLCLALCKPGGVCLWKRVCECACVICVFALPGTVHAIPKEPCVCASMCVCFHHASCLLKFIHSLMTELHSEGLLPNRHTISNNVSWDWSQIMQWKLELT